MIYFLDTMPKIKNTSEIPSGLHMMQHVYRSEAYDKNTKSISNTDTVLTIGAHSHQMCVEGITCQKPKIEWANTHHYRRDCPTYKYFNGIEKCKEFETNTVKDTRVWRHLKTVVNKTNIALKNIFLN